MRGRSASVRYAAFVAILAGAVWAGSAYGGKQADPEISGIPQEGQTLSASVPGGPEPDNWQWERCSSSPVEDCEIPSRGGQFWTQISGADEDTYTLTSADVDHFVRVVAYDDPSSCARGGVSYCNPRFSDPVGPIAEAGAPPPPGQPPPPVANVSANLAPLQGVVLVKLPGTDVFIPLTREIQVPLGTVVDTTNGHVLVTSARNRGGETQNGEFWAGVFKLTQTDGDPLITKFELVDADEPAGRVAERGRRGRRLWGRGRCRCRTGGRHSAGTVRGTWWLTEERRRGTFTRVKRGKVRVFDFRRPKFILLRAGETYLAKPGD